MTTQGILLLVALLVPGLAGAQFGPNRPPPRAAPPTATLEHQKGFIGQQLLSYAPLSQPAEAVASRAQALTGALVAVVRELFGNGPLFYDQPLPPGCNDCKPVPEEARPAPGTAGSQAVRKVGMLEDFLAGDTTSGDRALYLKGLVQLAEAALAGAVTAKALDDALAGRLLLPQIFDRYRRYIAAAETVSFSLGDFCPSEPENFQDCNARDFVANVGDLPPGGKPYVVFTGLWDPSAWSGSPIPVRWAVHFAAPIDHLDLRIVQGGAVIRHFIYKPRPSDGQIPTATLWLPNEAERASLGETLVEMVAVDVFGGASERISVPLFHGSRVFREWHRHPGASLISSSDGSPSRRILEAELRRRGTSPIIIRYSGAPR